jgi:hypothetical protein
MYKKKEINFYQQSGMDSLPEDGWFQNCKCCKKTVTGNLKLITNIESKKDVKIFSIYTCKECEKKLKINDEKSIDYNILCHKLVYEYKENKFISDKFTGVQCFKTIENNNCCF